MQTYTRSTNDLLHGLLEDEWAALEPHIQRVPLPQGLVLCEADAPIELVYFPESGMISSVTVTTEGQSIEAILAGREGAIGYAAAFGAFNSPWRVIVQMPGEAATTIAPAALGVVLANAPELNRRLAVYSHTMQQFAGQSIACNRFHSVHERLARWLLTALDRQDGMEINLTQEFLAQMLGTYRPTVTVAQATLERAGLIRHIRRGRLEVIDRAGLEAASCECYARLAHLAPRHD